MENYAGRSIDRYQVIERLGQGGMAVVYRAYDTRLEREVAIKVIRTEAIPPDQHGQLLKRFEREAKAQAQFSHPNIVPVIDYGEIDGTPYLVMAYIAGGILKQRVQGAAPSGPLPRLPVGVHIRWCMLPVMMRWLIVNGLAPVCQRKLSGKKLPVVMMAGAFAGVIRFLMVLWQLLLMPVLV